jgi:hypothetical protein
MGGNQQKIQQINQKVQKQVPILNQKPQKT